MSQAGLIDIEVSHPQIPTSFTTDTGTAIPLVNNLEILGTNGINTIGSGKTITVTVDTATAGATTLLATKGVASFDSAKFTVVDGFVSLIGTVGIETFITDDGAPAVSGDALGVINLLGGNSIGVIGQGPGNTITVSVTDTTEHTVQIGNATGSLTSLAAATNGQLVIGSTGAAPVIGSLTSTGATLDVTAGAGTLNIDTNASLQTDTGFAEWDAAGPYFDDTVLGDFTLLVAGSGYIHNVLVNWTAPQTVSGLTAGNTYGIYIDSTGTLQKTDSHTGSTYQDNIVLFQCLRDSTAVTNNQVTTKENHPYNFPVRTSNYIHNIIGSVIENNNNGANIILNGTKKIQINGSDELDDHGLETIIPDSGGVAVSWVKMFTLASGKWARQNFNDTFSGYWNNGGVPELLGASKYAIYRLFATKDNLNTTTPVYGAILDNAQYSNLSAADTAIANGTVANISGEIRDLEPVQLGYIIFKQSSDEIIQVIIDKTTLKSTTSSSGTNIASLVTTDTTNFNRWLSAADTNVQASLVTLDETGSDANFEISNDTDSTKVAKFDASGITTGTTRTVTLQDSDGTMAYLSDISGLGTSLSPYIVGATNSDYTTIQAAINQAVTDGASNTNQINIYVKPGTYTEDITVYDGINVIGMDSMHPCGETLGGFNAYSLSTVLVGNITIASGWTKIKNMLIEPTSIANVDLFDITTTGNVILTIEGCKLSNLNNAQSVFAVSGGQYFSVIVTDTTIYPRSGVGGQLFTETDTTGINFTIKNSRIVTAVTSATTDDCTVGFSAESSGISASLDFSSSTNVTFNMIQSKHSPTASDEVVEMGTSGTQNLSYHDCMILSSNYPSIIYGSANVNIYNTIMPTSATDKGIITHYNLGTGDVNVEYNLINKGTDSATSNTKYLASTVATGADPYSLYSIDSVTDFSVGIDNSDADAFKIGPNATPSTGTSSIEIATSGAVTLNEAYTLPTADGAANEVLTTDGSGTVTWETVSSAIAVTSIDNTDSPYTILSTDQHLSCDVSAGALTADLPDAPTTGTTYSVKDSGGDAATNNITVTTAGGAVNIDGATSYVMNTAYQANRFVFNGTTWDIL